MKAGVLIPNVGPRSGLALRAVERTQNQGLVAQKHLPAAVHRNGFQETRKDFECSLLFLSRALNSQPSVLEKQQPGFLVLTKEKLLFSAVEVFEDGRRMSSNGAELRDT